MKRLLYIAIIVLLSGCRPSVRSSHDVIYLVNGEEKTGTLEKITSDSVWFSTPEGKLEAAKSEVASIDIPQPREGDQWKTVKDIDDPVLKEVLSSFTPPEDIGLSDVNFINLYVEHTYSLRDDGKAEVRERVIRFITAEAGKGQAANNTWLYLSDRSRAKLDFARGITLEGIVTSINEAAINRTSLYPAPAEYSNLMQIQIAVPESKLGSILDFQFSKIVDVIDSLHPFSEQLILESNEPTLKEIVKVEQPQNGPLAVWVSTGDAPRKETRQGREILTWEIPTQLPKRFEYNLPPSADYLPRFIVSEKGDWQTIAARLKPSFDYAVTPGSTLASLVDSLTKGLSTSEEKARALYSFVATNVRYTGPAPDRFSYAPTQCEDVLSRRFANNLDRATLLYAMMLEAGLDADLVLIRSRWSGRLIPSFPSLGQLNYALVLFEDRIWLDPVPDLAYGTLNEQDAMGLSISSGKLKKTPFLSPAEDASVTHSEARLNSDGSLDLTTRVDFTGRTSYSWKSYLKPMSADERKQEAERLASEIHPNAALRSFEFKGVENLNDNVSYTLRVSIPDYAVSAGDYLLFYLPGVTHSAYSVGSAQRLYPIDRRTRTSDMLDLTLELPAGAVLLELPKDVSLKTKQDSYSATNLTPRPGAMKFTESVQVLDPWIAPEAYPEYKALIEGMARVNQKPLVLKLK
ncbi:DUF3857 domain-containing protein [bacterium]|nr:DUF3857 domain-containing protein [bacterium]